MAGQAAHMAIGGWAPRGWMTETGSNAPLLRDTYGLKEFVDAKGYPARAKANVDDSDATVAFRLGPSRGPDSTIGWCMSRDWSRKDVASRDDGHRPVLVLNGSTNKHKKAFCDFIARNKVRTLNVAGHRLSTCPDPQIETRVCAFLVGAVPAVRAMPVLAKDLLYNYSFGTRGNAIVLRKGVLGSPGRILDSRSLSKAQMPTRRALKLDRQLERGLQWLTESIMKRQRWLSA